MIRKNKFDSINAAYSPKIKKYICQWNNRNVT